MSTRRRVRACAERVASHIVRHPDKVQIGEEENFRRSTAEPGRTRCAELSCSLVPYLLPRPVLAALRKALRERWTAICNLDVRIEHFAASAAHRTERYVGCKQNLKQLVNDRFRPFRVQGDGNELSPVGVNGQGISKGSPFWVLQPPHNIRPRLTCRAVLEGVS